MYSHQLYLSGDYFIWRLFCLAIILSGDFFRSFYFDLFPDILKTIPHHHACSIQIIHSSTNHQCIPRLAMVPLMRSDKLLVIDDVMLPNHNFVSTFVNESEIMGPSAVLCLSGSPESQKRRSGRMQLKRICRMAPASEDLVDLDFALLSMHAFVSQ